MDKFVKKITKEIVLNITRYHDKAEIIEYGLYMFFSDTLKVITLLLLSMPLHLFYEVLIAIFTFGMLRVFLGGIHGKNELECIIIYPITIYSVVCISKFLNVTYINIITFAISIILVCLYAPADLKSKPILSKQRYMKLKVLGLLELIILFIISFFVPIFYRNLIALNSITVSFMLTPIAYKISGCTRPKILRG